MIGGRTGLFFDSQNPQAIRAAVERFEAAGAGVFDPADIATHAAGFGAERFRREFAAVATAQDPAAALINGNIQVSGDTAPLLALRKLLSELELDWEHPLAEAFGDVAAR